MRRLVAFLMAVAVVTACNGTTDPEKKARAEDPYITVRVTNNLDTTTAPGRTPWRIYALIYSEQVNQQGFAYSGSMTLTDIRNGFNIACMGVGSDSIGQRLIEPFALGDTVNKQPLTEAVADPIVAEWMNGNHNLPAGYMAIRIPPVDAWTSEQFAAGHGRVPADPIKWKWDWTGTGQTTFLERTASDTARCNSA